MVWKDIPKEIKRIDEIGQGKTILERFEDIPKTLGEVRELDTLNLDILDAVLDHHTQIAEMIIKKALKRFPNCHPYIAFSGGKSSLVLIKILSKVVEDYSVIFSNTLIEYPDTIKFVRSFTTKRNLNYIEVKPKATFFKMLNNGHNFPSKYDRWCCTPLKSNPSEDWFIENDIEPLLFLGEHKSENSYRYHYLPFDLFNTKNANAHVFHPLLYMDEWEIWRYIDRNQLEYLELYKKGVKYKDKWRHWHSLQYERNGCWLCPCGHVPSYPQFLLLKAWYPKHWRLLKRCVQGVRTANSQ